MALELQKQNYMAQAGSAPVTSGNASNASAPINIPIGQVEEEYVVDNQTQATAQPQTKRTVEELYQSIANICKTHGLNVSEAQNIGLLSSISGKTEEELLNVEQSEINQIVQKLTIAINAIKEDIDAIRNGEKELTFDLIKNYVRLLNGEVPKGWDSVESFRKAQRKGNKPESLAERLNRMYGCDVSKLSTEQLAKKLEAYFDGYFNELNSKGLSREKVDNLQLTDFTKLLFNSTPEEYSMFRDAIEYLVVNNRCQGYKAILDSFETDAQRTKFVKTTPEGYVKRVMTTPDQRGEVASKEQNEEFIATHLEYMDKEDIAEYTEESTNSAKDFYSEENKEILEKIQSNPEIIKNIQEKLAKGEALTEEEQKLLEVFAKDNHHRGNSSGQFIGTANNKVIGEAAINELLKTINTNTYEIGQQAGEDYYKEVLQAVEKYIEENQERLTLPKEELANIIDKATDGNYTRVINGATTEELIAPTTTTEKPETKNSVQSNDLGFSNTKEVDTTKLENITKEINQNSIVEDATPRITRNSRSTTPIYTPQSTLKDYVQNEGKYKGFKSYAKDFGLFKAIIETLKKPEKADKTQIKKEIKKQNTTNQTKIIQASGVSTIDLILEWVRNDAIQKLEGTILRSSILTKALKNKNEEIKEENTVNA